MVGYQPINDTARLSLPEDLLKGRTVGLAPLAPGERHRCTASTPCADGDSLFDACDVPPASIPLLAASLEAQRELAK
jgi:hypothetical protein